MATFSEYMNSLMPGSATRKGTDYIESMISGLPSPDEARQKAAYFGAATGMPGSEFARNVGYDMYGRQAEQRRQTGFKNLMAYLTGVIPMAMQYDTEQNRGLERLRDEGRAANEFAQRFGLEQYKLGMANRPRTVGSNKLELPTNWNGMVHLSPYTGRASFMPGQL